MNFERFGQGLDYETFLTRHGTDVHRQRWRDFRAQVRLSDAQQKLLASFTRSMPVLCLAGAWCGDCVQQCPIFDVFAAASSKIDLRFLDRDAHPDVQAELQICGGNRVPVVVFFSEDGTEIARRGDRTLAKYRSLVENLTGGTCPTGLGRDPLVDAVTQEWLDEFERAQWILRLSGRLRQKHGD
jgi:Thioredoxin